MAKLRPFDPKVFVKRFQQACQETGLNQMELAQKIGTSQGSISRFLYGSSVPRVSILFKMALALGVSSDWLLGLKNTRR
jgi:transcriptional regulator with XRE-family HTH domain